MKKVLIISRRMDIGGVEISLLNFLKSFDFSRFEITLLLQEAKGALLDRVPKQVTIKEMHFKGDEYLKLVQLDMKLPIIKELKFKIIAAKCKKTNSDNAFFYKALDYCQADLSEYDLAIDYHGYGYFTTIFMMNKVKAKKYITFIHDDKMDWMANIKSIQERIDYYFCVSKSCADHMKKEFPELSSKIRIFYNIIDENRIKHLANCKQEEIPNNVENVLITVGRLEWQKGYDFLLKVASELKKDINFKWYIIGSGSWKNRIQQQIKASQLEEYVYLLGSKTNPYPYVKRADVYVQTSRHEGYGIAICEARVLCKPIISTDLPCVREQIKDGMGGILSQFDVNIFEKNIFKVLKNKALQQMISAYHAKHPVNTLTQMKIFDTL